MQPKIDKIALVYIRARKLLVTRSKGKTLYYLPGGKREAGETDAQALAREIKEELSVDIIPGKLERMGIFEGPADGKPPGTIVKLTCYFGEFDGNIKPSAEIEETAWLSHSDKTRLAPAAWPVLDQLNEKGMLR
jgi:8-oxo-dGTP pyrophosphatase MutT (NUDIX family)